LLIFKLYIEYLQFLKDNSLFIFILAKLKRNPWQFRKSVYFDDPNIRDLIFKGYTIVFRINQNTIEVFGFLKFQKFPF